MSLSDYDDGNENDFKIDRVNEMNIYIPEYSVLRGKRKILKITVHTKTFFLIGKLVLFCIALLVPDGQSDGTTWIPPELELFIAVRTKVQNTHLPIMSL